MLQVLEELIPEELEQGARCQRWGDWDGPIMVMTRVLKVLEEKQCPETQICQLK